MTDLDRTLLDGIATVGPNYAVLDAARSPRILPLLKTNPAGHFCLYQGKKQKELAYYAPYLVQVAPADPWTHELLRKGWGKSWGVFVVAPPGSTEILCLHLRKMLFVKDSQQREAYFRYYDPRVLRTFLPACTSAEASQFFGPIQGFLLEGETPQDLLFFRKKADGIEKLTSTIRPTVDV